MSCCGRRSPVDWNLVVLPSSCCDFDDVTCTLPFAFPNGCANQLYDSIVGSGLVMAWIGICFGAVFVRKKITSRLLESY